MAGKPKTAETSRLVVGLRYYAGGGYEWISSVTTEEKDFPLEQTGMETVDASEGDVVLFLAGYALFDEVLRENEFLLRTIRASEGQRVVDTGLYGIVRHPIYAAAVVVLVLKHGAREGAAGLRRVQAARSLPPGAVRVAGRAPAPAVPFV